MNIHYSPTIVAPYSYFNYMGYNETIADPIELFYEEMVVQSEMNDVAVVRAMARQYDPVYRMNMENRKRIRELMKDRVPFTVSVSVKESIDVSSDYMHDGDDERLLEEKSYTTSTRIVFNVVITNPKHAIYYKLKWSK